MEILKEEVVTDLDAKQVLEEREKSGELKYEQKNALEVLRKISKTDPEKIKRLIEELKTVERLRDKHMVAIANYLPEDKDDLRAVLHKEYTSFAPEEIDKILQIVKSTI